MQPQARACCAAAAAAATADPVAAAPKPCWMFQQTSRRVEQRDGESEWACTVVKLTSDQCKGMQQKFSHLINVVQRHDKRSSFVQQQVILMITVVDRTSLVGPNLLQTPQ
jgi:hypothetical protein